MKEPEETSEHRIERVQFETDRHRIVGNVTLPPEGYQSRFSDSLNRGDIAFISIVDVEIWPIDGGEVVRREFVVVGKKHVRIAFPLEEAPGAGGSSAPGAPGDTPQA